LYILYQSTKPISLGISKANWSIENLFRDLSHSAEKRSATGEYNPTRQLSFPTRVFDLVCDVHQDFFRAGLQNIAKDLP
jgi:hypothetical protein